MVDDRHLSKLLSYWLRHRPDAASVQLDERGWAPVPAVLAAFARAGLPSSREDLDRVAATNDKQRFELSADGAFIRARQGHSVEVDLGWERAEPPPHLYHGTIARFLPAILADGLKPMSRHHVHLSPDEDTARRVGARRGTPVVLKVAAAEMASRGSSFYLTANGVWLTGAVPASYIEILHPA